MNNTVASYPINKYVGVELKYAKYDADEFSQDTDRDLVFSQCEVLIPDQNRGISISGGL